MMALAARNRKEILRDPINLLFGLAFPVALLLLLTAVQSNIPVQLFDASSLTPGICVFGLSFMTLFSAQLLAKDRGSAMLQRLYATPLRARDFILAYTLPMLPLSILQCLVCCATGLLLGMTPTWNLLFGIVLIVPVSLLFISLGLLCGSVFNDKQVGGICGALLTNLTALTSGIWFDPMMVGGVFGKIANAMPFLHAVELERAAFRGELSLPHLWWVLGYAAVAGIAAIALFLRQMKRQ